MACFPSTKMPVNWVNWPSHHMWDKETGHVKHAEAAGGTWWHWHSIAVFPLPSRNRGRRCRPSWQALPPQPRRRQLANSPADTRHHVRTKWNIKHRMTHQYNLPKIKSAHVLETAKALVPLHWICGTVEKSLCTNPRQVLRHAQALHTKRPRECQNICLRFG